MKICSRVQILLERGGSKCVKVRLAPVAACYESYLFIIILLTGSLSNATKQMYF